MVLGIVIGIIIGANVGFITFALISVNKSK